VGDVVDVDEKTIGVAKVDATKGVALEKTGATIV